MQKAQSMNKVSSSMNKTKSVRIKDKFGDQHLETPVVIAHKEEEN